jgi:hypothetical protein
MQICKSFLVLFFKKEQERKNVFFEKKKQKTFDYCLRGGAGLLALCTAGSAWADDAATSPATISVGARLLAAGAAFGFIFFFAGIVVKFKLHKYFIGMDKRVSNSQTQLVLWSTTALGVYLTTVLLRAYLGLGTANSDMFGGVDIPDHLLAVSGLSGLTFAGARTITTAKIDAAAAQGLAPKDPDRKDKKPASFYDLFQDDDGNVDLGDTQMILITVIAVVLYLAKSFVFWGSLKLDTSVTMPEVDTYLLASFGIGQGAYLAKKAGSSLGKG